MALKPIIDSLDKLPDVLKAEYRPGTAEEKLEGKFVLTVEPDSNGWSLENVAALKSSLSNVRTERDNAKESLKAFGDLKPDQVQKTLAEYEEFKKKGGTDAAFELRVKEVKDNHKRELDERANQLSEKDQAIERLLIEATATDALAELKGNPLFLMSHIKDQVRVRWVDDPKDKNKKVPVARVKDSSDPESDRITLKPGSTDPMDIKELVASMSKDEKFKGAFAGSGNSGSGGGGNSTTQGSNGSTLDVSKMSPTQQLAHYHATNKG